MFEKKHFSSQNNRFYKSVLTFNEIFSQLYKKNVEKNNPRFLKGFCDKSYISDFGISFF